MVLDKQPDGNNNKKVKDIDRWEKEIEERILCDDEDKSRPKHVHSFPLLLKERLG